LQKRKRLLYLDYNAIPNKKQTFSFSFSQISQKFICSVSPLSESGCGASVRAGPCPGVLQRAVPKVYI
jgi:hypothetical protein